MILRLASFLFMLGASLVSAQDIEVLSGEHEDFTRLVVMSRPGQTWELATQEGGYTLSLPGVEARFRLDRVFDRIPRTRLRDLQQVPGAAILRMETETAIIAEAFELAAGPIVIDFRQAPEDGPPPAPSPLPDAVVPPAPVAEDAEDRARNAPRTRIPIALPQEYLADFWKTERSGPAAPNDMAPALPALPSVFGLDDGRISEAEQALLEQLGRAAAQGLIRVDPTAELLPARKPPEPAPSVPDTAGSVPEPPAPEETGAVTAHLALRSMTSIDRELLTFLETQTPLGASAQCPPEADFDLASWIDGSSPTLQIGAARADLLGEFDIADPAAVLRLARVYLAFGFGVEARALIASFPLPPEQEFPVRLIASVLEEGDGVRHADLSALTACNSPAALWGLVASTGPIEGKVNLAAIQRSFSGLPAQMRGFVGPKLVERLIDIGALDVAQSVRSAFERSQPEVQAPLEMMRAQLELAEGNSAAAETHLMPLIAEDGGFSPEALILLIEEKVAQRQPVAAEVTENAGALAFELGMTPDAPRLQRAHALGLGSVGSFDAAFEQLGQMTTQAAASLRAQTVQDLFRMIGALELEPLFLQAYFTHRWQIAELDLPADLRFALAERLVQAGFPEAGREVLEDAAFGTARGRLVLGRAALAARDAPAALSHLGGLDLPEAQEMRAQAHMILGDYEAARAEFEQAGRAEDALAAAWRAGDWQAVDAGGSPAQKGFIDAFDLLPVSPDEGATDPALAPAARDPADASVGLLTRSRELLEQSASERAALEQLLQTLAGPASGS